MAREGQGYPCYQRDMMMMTMFSKYKTNNEPVGFWVLTAGHDDTNDSDMEG